MPGQSSYMLIFNDMLKRHNEAQAKYAPLQRNLAQAKLILSPMTAPSVNRSSSNSEPSSQSHKSMPSSTFLNSANPPQPTPTTTNPPNKRSISNQSAISSRSMTGQSLAIKEISLKLNKISTAKLAKKVNRIDFSDRRTASFSEHNKSVNFSPSTSLIKGAKFSIKLPVAKVATLKDQKKPGAHQKEGSSTFSQTPAAKISDSSSQSLPIEANRQKLAHLSLAKTIAEQTPYGFKTLGPGFNRLAPIEKSLNSNGNEKSGSLVNMPSDYEHIFHAPSQINDLPGYEDYNIEQTRRHKSSQQQQPQIPNTTTTAAAAAATPPPPPPPPPTTTTTTTQQQHHHHHRHHRQKNKRSK